MIIIYLKNQRYVILDCKLFFKLFLNNYEHFFSNILVYRRQTPLESSCVVSKIAKTPSNSTMHYVSEVIKTFLENCIQAILNFGIGLHRTKDYKKIFKLFIPFKI